MYFKRDLEQAIRQALAQFPAILVTGPRQAGKSTLLKQTFSTYSYVTLDDPDERQLARDDPELFLNLRPTPLIIDEIQYAPNLLSYLKIRIDANRDQYGQYILTGSQVFQLMQGVSESLAGRIAIFQLLPLSWNEISHIPDYERHMFDENATAQQIVRGFYPESLKISNFDRNTWYASYLSTYLERDVRNIKAITDLHRFQTFIRLLATRAGSLLNHTEIGKECGITGPTVKDWITILEATYVIKLLRPYHSNHGKRLVKSPKLYFVDTGLLCHLLGIDCADRFFKAAERGNIFENMVVMEAMKKATVIGAHTDFFFYRTAQGLEVDLLIECHGKLHAYEIKLARKISSTHARNLTQFQKDHPDADCQILSLRDTPHPITRTINATHWSSVASNL